MNYSLKNFFEKITGSKIYRNSLPRGVLLTADIKRLYNKNIDHIWDVGAHKGETTLFFAEEFPESQIKSFEPVTENFNELVINCSHLKNQQSFQFALGNKINEMELHLHQQ